MENEAALVPVSPSPTNEISHDQAVQEPMVPNLPDTRSSDGAHRNHPETSNARPGTLMIVHGTMPNDEGTTRPSSIDSSSPEHSELPRASSSAETASGDPPSTSQRTSVSSEASPSVGSWASVSPDDRLQTSIDVLAALLSMATAATATSLLTGTTDVLSTLSSDSPSGPQVSPTRARAAWDTLEGLFYLRSTRRQTLPPHIELFRDLALAVLTSRSSHIPRMPAETRASRPPLPPGTFERFLIDLNANVRNSLREDYVRRSSGECSGPLLRSVAQEYMVTAHRFC